MAGNFRGRFGLAPREVLAAKGFGANPRDGDHGKARKPDDFPVGQQQPLGACGNPGLAIQPRPHPGDQVGERPAPQSSRPRHNDCVRGGATEAGQGRLDRLLDPSGTFWPY